MATITIDPLNRIEGHLKCVVTVNDGTGVVTDAACTGTMFRGFELILNRRDPRDAPQITQRICGVCPTPHGFASTKCLDMALLYTVDSGRSTTDGNYNADGYSTVIPDNGIIIRNLIHGSEYLMSHVTHLYHLSALDFINTSTFPGMGPWLPSYTASDMLDGSTGVGATLVNNYVTALSMRRKAATLGAMFGGRKPIQNAMVPGGVTTLYSSTIPLSPSSTQDYDLFGPYNATDTNANFSALLNDVRAFINTTYIPDVVTVANAYPAFWSQGIGCGRLLSYGDYPQNSSGRLLLKRGIATGTTLSTFDVANVAEYVDYSWYSYGLGETFLHPFSGRTEPNMGTANGYSWLKSPRYMNGTTPQVCEVGPLARMVITALSGDQVTVTDADLPASQRLLGGALGASYNAIGLVNAALGLVSQPVTSLYSVLGRHAARALEAKYVADAMAIWLTQLTPDASCYTYKRIPKQISSGYGLVEAQRGALGHWIKIEGRKIAKYQCVVPTTWNASPKDGAGQHGPAEAALVGSNVGTNPTDQIVNILRILHPFDFCIACAVHVVNPKGEEIAKFAIDPSGKPAAISFTG